MTNREFRAYLLAKRMKGELPRIPDLLTVYDLAQKIYRVEKDTDGFFKVFCNGQVATDPELRENSFNSYRTAEKYLVAMMEGLS